MSSSPKTKRKGESRTKYARLRRDGLKLFIDDDLNLRQIAERLGVNHTTVKRWSTAGQWVSRRSDAIASKDRKSSRALRHELRHKLPEAVKRNLNITEGLLKRSAAVIMNRGRFCDHCGRGADSDAGVFRPTASDVASLIKLEMHLLGGDQQTEADLVSDSLPELPEGFVIRAAILFAEFEGTMPAMALVEDGSVLIGAATEEANEAE